MGGTIQSLVRQVDPTMPLPQVSTVAERVEAATRQETLIALLSVAFAGLALVLALVGLSGLMAYTVARRRDEFGLRLALGASPRGLQALVMRDSVVMVGSGLLLGIGSALLIGSRLAPMFFNLEPTDPVVFAGAVALLTTTTLVAAYIPARRGSRVDPVAALRAA
jgi:ABC-type antimicrobial peptide transport system permease subunit